VRSLRDRKKEHIAFGSLLSSLPGTPLEEVNSCHSTTETVKANAQTDVRLCAIKSDEDTLPSLKKYASGSYKTRTKYENAPSKKCPLRKVKGVAL